jgi:hypothetical protein
MPYTTEQAFCECCTHSLLVTGFPVYIAPRERNYGRLRKDTVGVQRRKHPRWHASARARVL